MAELPDAALRAAYEAHGGELFRFARRSLGDAGLAEDAVQEAFVRAWRASASYDPAKRQPAHLAVRHPAQRRRSTSPGPGGAARRSPPADDDAGPDDERPPCDDGIDQMLTVWQVEAALAELADDHRTALVEVHWRGRPYADVADELGVPEGTVKSRVYYGLRAMRERAGVARMADGWRDG